LIFLWIFWETNGPEETKSMHQLDFPNKSTWNVVVNKILTEHGGIHHGQDLEL
jgi:hypothetical protein